MNGHPLRPALAALATGIVLTSTAHAADPSPAVTRGEYLVATAGCGDCQPPTKMGANGPEPDASRMLSGHPEALVMPPIPKFPAGPWLVVSSATHTPGPDRGA
jgi:hypothetical protein